MVERFQEIELDKSISKITYTLRIKLQDFCKNYVARLDLSRDGTSAFESSTTEYQD
jgi:hypothetical protein